MDGPAPGERRVLSVPNAVTAVRLCCIPFFVVLVTGSGRRGWFPAAVLLAVLGATDWVDGFLARRLGQVTTLGKVLDPLADRLLLATAAISCIVLGAVPVVVAVIALAREAVVATGFVVLAAAGGRRMDVALPGKAATLCLMTALPLFLAGHATVGWASLAEALGWAFAVPALILGWYSVVGYVPAARVAWAERRAEGTQRTLTPR